MTSFYSNHLGDRVLTVADHEPEAVDAPTTCRRLEEALGNGYAVYAWCDGRIIADADGWAGGEGAPPHDAATATGMYDS
jgi:hypothetical protein